jgi:dolichyl-phosphate-mannose--protein O-mannosyl transferase
MNPIVRINVLSKNYTHVFLTTVKSHNQTSIVKEVSSRIWSMMIVPMVVYLLCFQLHFYILYRSGDHDLLLSPELRSSINEFRIGSSQNGNTMKISNW